MHTKPEKGVERGDRVHNYVALTNHFHRQQVSKACTVTSTENTTMWSFIRAVPVREMWPAPDGRMNIHQKWPHVFMRGEHSQKHVTDAQEGCSHCWVTVVLLKDANHNNINRLERRGLATPVEKASRTAGGVKRGAIRKSSVPGVPCGPMPPAPPPTRNGRTTA